MRTSSHTLRFVIAFTVCAYGLLSAAGAQAQQARRAEDHKLRLEGYFRLAFGGEADIEIAGGPFSTEVEADLDTGFGFGGGMEYILHPNFSLGARAQLLFISVDNSESDGFAFDMNLFPRGRFAIANAPVAIYGGLPLGLSFVTLDFDDDSESGVGFNIGFLFGAEFFATEAIGFFAEFGYQWHLFSLEPGGADADFVTGTLLFQGGAKFAF